MNSPTVSTNRVRIEIETVKDLLPQNLGYVNTIFINLQGEIEELLEDQNGMVTQLGSYQAPYISPIRLQPRNFTPRHISQLLHHTVADDQFCQIVSEKIALDCVSLPAPFLLSVNVKLTREVRVMLPSVTVASKASVSDDVLRRLVEEQSVDLEKKEEEEHATCSICLEDLSGSSSEIQGNIIRLPNCLHLFHQDCLFEWLKRKNSCPLCRRVPYDEDHDRETQVLA